MSHSSLSLRAATAVQATVVCALARRRDDAGQSTAEYALVMLGAATVALMLITWAGQTDKIGRLLDGVLDSILERFS
jgi:hypothetical protein